jgi:hypothetical protein
LDANYSTTECVDEPYNGPRTSSTIDCNKSSSMAILHQQQKCYQEYHREPFSVHVLVDGNAQVLTRVNNIKLVVMQCVVSWDGASLR